MPTLAVLEAKWQQRLSEWRALGVAVNGEKIAGEVLEDLHALSSEQNNVTMSPTEAAAITNYHPESIARLARTGKVPNYGTKHRPRVKVSELPRKAERTVAKATSRAASSVAGSIALDAVAGRIGR